MRAFVAAAALTVLVAVVLVVREATMSRHHAAPTTGALEVVFDLEENQATATRLEAARALVQVCALEVRGNLVTGSLAILGGDGTVRARISPVLDETDQAQLHGCMEDMWVEHVQADVLTMRPLTS